MVALAGVKFILKAPGEAVNGGGLPAVGRKGVPYGEVPPEAEIVRIYGLPTAPFGSVAGVSVRGGLMTKLTVLEERPVHLAPRITGKFVGVETDPGISVARIVAVAMVVVAAVSGRMTPLKLIKFPGMNVTPIASSQKSVPVKVSEKFPAAPAVRAVGLKDVITGAVPPPCP